jgi:hypothetical protein
MGILEEVSDDYERAQALVNILIDQATGKISEDFAFKELRSYFVKDNNLSQYIPRWLVFIRSLSQFWSFISKKSQTYAGRRDFLWGEFDSLLSYLESTSLGIVNPEVTFGLEVLNSESINRAWKKALERQANDPEGAITAERTLWRLFVSISLKRKKLFMTKRSVSSTLQACFRLH